MSLNKIQRRRRDGGQTLTARALRRLATLGCASGLLACDSDGPILLDIEPAPEGAHPDALNHNAPLAAITPVTALELETDAPVCPASRVIAIRAAGTCPTAIVRSAGQWHGGALFVGDDLPPALAVVCQYTWQSADHAAPDLTPFALPHFTAVGSDCEVNWPQGDALSDLLAEPLRDAFYDHLGRLDAAGLPKIAAAPVIVALPDTASKANVEMNSDHAASMGGIIDSIACPGGAACPVKIERNLALPLLADGEPDYVHGGFHGSQGQLARAIHAAVEQWKHTPGAPRLVINLSVGWEPGKFGGAETPTNMPAPVLAVHRALQFAGCHDALIIAAAGNTAGDECATGPLAPALWEDLPGLPPNLCNALYGVTPTWDPSTQPLVYAVAGVDHRNRPLQNTRPDGRPGLAAPAFAAVADGHDGLTTALTGSSVAAAAVSGIAALILAYNPNLSPGQVMSRIYASGAPLLPTTSPDFGARAEIRRASVCQALAYGCKGNCPALPCPAAVVDLAALTLAADDAAVALAPTMLPALDATGHVLADTCEAMCGTADLYTGTTQAAQPDVCGGDLVGGRDRYTDPQPSWPACPVCFASDDTVSLVVGEDYDGLAVTSMLLEVTDGTDDQRYQLEPTSALSAEFVTEVRLPAGAAIDPTHQRAILHLTFATGETHSNAIPVY